MTEDELRLRRIQDHRRCLEAGLVDQFGYQKHGLWRHDIEEIIADLRYVENLIRDTVIYGAWSSF